MGEFIKKKWWIGLLVLLLIIIMINKMNEEQIPSKSYTQDENSLQDQKENQIGNKLDGEKNVQNTTQTVTKSDDSPTSSPATEQQQSSFIGIGSRDTEIEAKYGQNETPDGAFALYQDKSVLITYIDNRASDISLEYEATDDTRRSRKEAIQDAQEWIPKDSIKIKEYDPDNEHHVLNYRSKELGKLIPDYYKDAKEYGSTDAPGTFTIYTKQDSEGVYMVGISLGSYQ